MLFRKQKINPLEPLQRPTYQVINILKYYRDINGYVAKVLGHDEKGCLELYYFNDRKRTGVPVIDGDLIIISNYQPNHYKLLKIDFSKKNLFSELMTCDRDRSRIDDFIIKHNLSNPIAIEEKKYQISPILADFMIKSLNHIEYKTKSFRLNEICILFKIELDGYYYTADEIKSMRDDFYVAQSAAGVDIHTILDSKLYTIYQLYGRSIFELGEIYSKTGRISLTVQELIKIIKEGKYNYEFNL